MFTGRRPRAFQFSVGTAILWQAWIRRKNEAADARRLTQISVIRVHPRLNYTSSASTMLVGSSVGITRRSLKL